jgi:ankyrin repeat protein
MGYARFSVRIKPNQTKLCFSDFERRLVKTSKVDVEDDLTAIAASTLATSGSRVIAKPLQALAKLRKAPRMAKMDNVAPLLKSNSTNYTSEANEFSFLAYASRQWVAHTGSFTEELQAWTNFRRLVLEDGHFASLSFHLHSTSDEKLLPWYIVEFRQKALLNGLLRWRPRLLDDYIVGLFRALCDKGMVELVAIVLKFDKVTEDTVVHLIESVSAAGNAATMDVLISLTTNIDVRNKYLAHALCAAVENAQVDIVHQALAAGADINADIDRGYGSTPLTAAVKRSDMDMFKLLLDSGARFSDEGTAFLVGDGYTSGRLRLGESPEDFGGSLPLSSNEVTLDFIKRLLRVGVRLNFETSQQTALQSVVGQGLLEVTDVLLRAGADVNATPAHYYGRTALQAAAEGGDMRLVDRLLEAGADVNAEPAGFGGLTALQSAAAAGYLEIAVRLLAVGAKVNAMPLLERGQSAIQAAAATGKIEMVNLLLEAGADVNMSAAIGGQTPLQAAAGTGELTVVSRLLGAGANVNAEPAKERGRSALQAAAATGNLKIVDLLLRAGADVNAAPAGVGGRTALQAAAEAGDLKMVNRLLDAGAKANADPAPVAGRSALQAAAPAGNWDVIH